MFERTSLFCFVGGGVAPSNSFEVDLIYLKGIDIQFYEVYYNGEKKFFDIRKVQ